MAQPGADTTETKYCRDNTDLDRSGFCLSLPVPKDGLASSPGGKGTDFKPRENSSFSFVKTVPLYCNLALITK